MYDRLLNQFSWTQRITIIQSSVYKKFLFTRTTLNRNIHAIELNQLLYSTHPHKATVNISSQFLKALVTNVILPFYFYSCFQNLCFSFTNTQKRKTLEVKTHTFTATTKSPIKHNLTKAISCTVCLHLLMLTGDYNGHIHVGISWGWIPILVIDVQCLQHQAAWVVHELATVMFAGYISVFFW